MPRSGITPLRKIEADPIYNSELITKFINRIMESGKKQVARKLVYAALDEIKAQTKRDPLDVFEEAMRNITPQTEVRPRRVGGATYQVPMEVRGVRKESLAIRWLIFAATARPNKDFKTMSAKLAAEIIDAAHNQGGAVKKRVDTQKMADANKAFSHFRW